MLAALSSSEKYPLSEAKRSILQNLRQHIQCIEGQNEPKFLSSSLLPAGFPVGKISELCGTGKTALLTQVIREQKNYSVAWIESHFTLNPFALYQDGLNLERFFFFESLEVEWLVSQILQSRLFSIVVVNYSSFNTLSLRRFQLLLEKTDCTFFLLSEEFQQSWVPALQVRVSKTYSSRKRQAQNKTACLTKHIGSASSLHTQAQPQNYLQAHDAQVDAQIHCQVLRARGVACF